MRLGSGEHHGWERPRTAAVVQVLDGERCAGEFAQVRVPEGAKGGPFDAVVRARVGEVVPWRSPAAGERIQVQAWVLDADAAALLELSGELGEQGAWSPPKPAPDLWLWVEG